MRKYGPKQLRKAGEAMFGPRWQTDLARALKLSDARRIREWIKGDRKIPDGIWPEVVELLKFRKIKIDAVLKDMEG